MRRAVWAQIKKLKSHMKKVLLFVLAILFLSSCGTSVYLINQYQKDETLIIKNAVYHFGKTIGLSTKADKGELVIVNDSIKVIGKDTTNIPFDKITSVQRHIINGLGTMIQVDMDTTSFFVTEVRLNICGEFVIINKMGTEDLLSYLKMKTGK